MLLRRYSKWIVLTGAVLILFIKLYIRPYVPLEGVVNYMEGVAPNFIAAFVMPFGAYWLYTHPLFFNGLLLRFPFFSDTRLVSLFGFTLIVINEYFQLMPVWGRTFDYLDIVSSAIGQLSAYYAFILLQRKLSIL